MERFKNEINSPETINKLKNIIKDNPNDSFNCFDNII